MKKLKVIISGGGTGGHIYPAVAVAQEIRNRIPDAEILFVGASNRMEMEKVPKAGFPIEGLWISGIQRSLSVQNLSWPFKVAVSVIRSLKILRRFQPDVAIGFGGYASGAMLYAATMKKIPSVIHEQNSFAGVTNKILRNRVDTICVAYEKMERFFPARKLVMTGNPIRQDLMHVENFREDGYRFFKLDPSKKTILIIGGSLGARTINHSIAAGLDKLKAAGLQLLWQTGKTFQPPAITDDDPVRISPFIYEMNLAYAIADVVVSRAGALSIAELAQVKKPVILVPSPNVAEDHQTKNAMALVHREAALLVKDVDAANVLINEVISLAANEVKQVKLKNNIGSFAMPAASARIVEEVFRVIKG